MSEALSTILRGMGRAMKIIFGGDTMLGRLVKDVIHEKGPHYPLENIASLMKNADLTIINLECAITDSTHKWTGAPKTFYFGAPSAAIHSLLEAGVDLVNLANNHALDYDYQGLLDTLDILKKNNINFAGAGKDLTDALKVAVVKSKGLSFGMLAYCDHQDDFAATDKSPGIVYLDLSDEQQAIKRITTDVKKLLDLGVDWPILSMHWGPNMVNRPSDKFKRIAHAAIDAGYKILFGHSAHVFHGIEIYKSCPIIYAAGDLVDDYYVDPDFRNDHQLLFELEIENNRLQQINLYPVFIENFQTRFAKGSEFNFIAERMMRLSGEMGTEIERDRQEKLVVNLKLKN